MGHLADAFAVVETEDVRVAKVVGHPEDWPLGELLEMVQEGTAWGAELDLSFGAEPGQVVLLDDQGIPRLVVTLLKG